MKRPKSLFALVEERARLFASKNPGFEITLSTTIKSNALPLYKKKRKVKKVARG